jgi:HD-GYP domain-containing protein (c-di-GMP phosphodiesterase class II)
LKPNGMTPEASQLHRLVAFQQQIEPVKDLDVLLEKILAAACVLCRADAGSIYTIDGDRLRFELSRNNTLQRALPAGQKLIFDKFTVPLDHRSVAGHVGLTGGVVNVPDVTTFDFSGLGCAFDPSYDHKSGYETRSLLTVPLKVAGDRIIGVMQLINALDTDGHPTPFSEESIAVLRLFAAAAATAMERAALTRSMIIRMISMAKLRDPSETGPHANRVAAYAAAIYEQWGRRGNLPAAHIERQRDNIRIAAMLHDVGKVGIPDHILKKPGKLDEGEYSEMKQHTTRGAALFAERHSPLDEISLEIALNHHEKWDGTGYPSGLRGEEIPIFARIVAVADVFDALSKRRCYKPAWTEEQVLAELKKCSGTHFDPAVVECFFACLDEVRAIARQFPDEDES